MAKKYPETQSQRVIPTQEHAVAHKTAVRMIKAGAHKADVVMLLRMAYRGIPRMVA